MKRKKPKKKRVSNEGWRVVRVSLPEDFIKGLSATRDENNNPVPLPMVRGVAIINRMAKALSVAEDLGQKVQMLMKELERRGGNAEEGIKEDSGIVGPEDG